MDPETLSATFIVSDGTQSEVRDAIGSNALYIQDAGQPRAAGDVGIVLATVFPSIGALALVLEKIRRLRLPRTYVILGLARVEVLHDPSTNDGRFVVISASGVVTELKDQGISGADLAAALETGSTPTRSA